MKRNGSDAPVKLMSQKAGSEEGILMNSISPENKLVLVPPNVKIPPNATSDGVVSLRSLLSQKDISFVWSEPLLDKACQKGVAPVLAMAWKARPMIPERVLSTRPDEILLA